jgi:copper(I)-binding protein
MSVLKKCLLFIASMLVMNFSFAQSTSNIQITEPMVRSTLPGQMMSSAYLTIENKGNVADRLISASFSGAKEVQIHEMKMDGDTMKMRQMNSLEIPAKGKAQLSPGGNHLMLMNLKDPIQDGQSIKMILQFEKAGKVEIEIPAKSMKMQMH